jgi:hypothetical protein
MSTNIVILGSKQEAHALVGALTPALAPALVPTPAPTRGSGDGDSPSTFQWQQETLELAAVTGLVVSGCSGCCNPVALEAFLTLISLRALSISFNGIANLGTLACLSKLQHVDLSHNKISDLEGLRDMLCLRTVRCNNNQISSIDPLRALGTLEELWISSNNIAWESMIHLQTLGNLKCIVMYNNPLEKKPKIEEFIRALCPTLELVNGVSFSQNGNGFLSTPDGRVMVTQARAQLTSMQREDIVAHTMKRKKSSHALLKSGLSLRSLMTSQTEEDISDEKGSNLRSTLSAGANIGGDDKLSSPSKSEPGGGGGKGSRVFKAQRKKKLSGIGQRYDHGTSVSAASPGPGVADGEPGLPGLSLSPKAARSGDDKASTTLHFGKDNSSPIAVCLYPNGNGYARYA